MYCFSHQYLIIPSVHYGKVVIIFISHHVVDGYQEEKKTSRPWNLNGERYLSSQLVDNSLFKAIGGWIKILFCYKGVFVRKMQKSNIVAFIKTHFLKPVLTLANTPFMYFAFPPLPPLFFFVQILRDFTQLYTKFWTSVQCFGIVQCWSWWSENNLFIQVLPGWECRWQAFEAHFSSQHSLATKVAVQPMPNPSYSATKATLEIALHFIILHCAKWICTAKQQNITSVQSVKCTPMQFVQIHFAIWTIIHLQFGQMYEWKTMYCNSVLCKVLQSNKVRWIAVAERLHPR